eukprot:TRINITY_DN6407_c0_g1_i1.p2 TRINITY_DN6407_c0_g1~~TRINITY_DN6407_c0_g1_i1.p2  ORF type:complete len:103 (-),score=26.61 TRINITY_DN6407_c0_g1_i1:106-414(-)
MNRESELRSESEMYNLMLKEELDNKNKQLAVIVEKLKFYEAKEDNVKTDELINVFRKENEELKKRNLSLTRSIRQKDSVAKDLERKLDSLEDLLEDIQNSDL